MSTREKFEPIYFSEDRNSVDTDLFDLHLNHMTTENLRSKAAIAIELAYRDQQIESRDKEIEQLKTALDLARDYISSDVENKIKPANPVYLLHHIDKALKSGEEGVDDEN